jgi:hypothetical protein
MGIPRPKEADDPKVQELMEKIVRLDDSQMKGLVWRVEEYLREGQFVKRWKQMMEDSPLLAGLHEAVAPVVRELGEKISKLRKRRKLHKS